MRIVFLIITVTLSFAANAQFRDYTYDEMKAEAALAYKQSHYRNAIYWAESCLWLDSTDASLYNLRACATIYSGPINDNENCDTAILYFGKAIRFDSTNYRYYSNRGWIYQTIDKNKSAFKDFKRALSLDSTVVDLHQKVLMNLWVQKRNKEAYAMTNEVIKRFPGDGYAWYVRGQLKRDYLKKYVEGNKDIKKSEALGWRQGFWLYDETF